MMARDSVFLIGGGWDDAAFPATYGHFLAALAFVGFPTDAYGRPVEETPGRKRRW